MLKNSIMYKNLSYISRETRVPFDRLMCNTFGVTHIKILLKKKDKYEDIWRAKLIKELIECKEQSSKSLYNREEIIFTLSYLCTE